MEALVGNGNPAALGTLGSDEAALRRLCSELRLTRTVARWLMGSGFADPATLKGFLEPRLSDLTNPEAMLDRERAADRLARAVDRGEPIVVFGDYDCDGMTATAVLTEGLRLLGGRVTPLLASRFDGGYGLSGPALARVLAQAPKVLVTCDCGSSDHQSLAEVGRQGVDAIVVDHHLVPEAPLPALAFLNPHRPGCGFAYKGLASCGLALVLLARVRQKLNRALDLKQFLDLVAIGTIADVAPLDRDNRALVRAGLSQLSVTRRPGLRALLALAGLRGEAVLTSEDVNFRIAPRLNAPGRMGSPDAALELLMASNEEAGEGLASLLEQTGEARKSLQEEMLKDALGEIETRGYAEQSALVVGRQGWNHGIVGIVAGRLASRFGKPAVVIGFDGDVGTGSVRGPEGFRLHDAISQCAHLLDRFGGHQAAVGVTLRFEKLEEFRTLFEGACDAVGRKPMDTKGRVCETPYLPPDDPRQVLDDLNRLEPCGLKNPRPDLLIEAKVLQAKEVRGGHLKLQLLLGEKHQLSAFAPEQGSLALVPESLCRMAGRLRPDRFRGGGQVELYVTRIEPA